VTPDGVAVRGALLNSTTTDSWDDSIPTDCKWGNGADGPFVFDPDGDVRGSIPSTETDCYDGLRNFNQVRPAVFDGGYAFDAVCAAGLNVDGGCDAGFVSPMPIGDYIVEMVAPLGYEILKPEDKTVDFGDAYEPVPELLPAACVGELALIPPYLTLFPDEQIRSPSDLLVRGLPARPTAALRPQARHPVGRLQRGRRLLVVHRGADRRSRLRLHPR